MEVEKGISSPLILPEAWADLTDWGFWGLGWEGKFPTLGLFCQLERSRTLQFPPLFCVVSEKEVGNMLEMELGFSRNRKEKESTFPP